ncbi:hypothetical protein KI387_001665, partial [Taxus chinensis]
RDRDARYGEFQRRICGGRGFEPRGRHKDADHEHEAGTRLSAAVFRSSGLR